MDLNWEFLVSNFGELTITGLSQGAIYALVALGYTLVYGVLRLINFAHSEVFMVGTFGIFFVWDWLGAGPNDPVPGIGMIMLLLVVGLGAAALTSGTVAFALERIAYRPLRKRNAPSLVFLITAIGASLAIAEFVGVRTDRRLYGFNQLVKPKPALTLTGLNWLQIGLTLAAVLGVVALVVLWRLGRLRFAGRTAVYLGQGRLVVALGLTLVTVAVGLMIVLQKIFDIGNAVTFKHAVVFTNVEVGIVTAAVVMMLVLDLFINRSRLGRGIRAVAQDPDTAALMGVNKDRVIALVFLLGGIMAGGAALLYVIKIQNTTFASGFLLGVKAFTAAVLGGIGNLRGALIGGLLLGVVENWGSALIGTQWKDVVSFLVLIVILMFRPTGLLGESLGKARA